MLSLFSLLENIYSGSRLALPPPCDCGLLWLLVLLLIGNLKRLVMLRCQAAALPSRAEPSRDRLVIGALQLKCLPCTVACVLRPLQPQPQLQLQLEPQLKSPCVCVCVRVLKLHASRSNNGNEIYRQNFAQRLLLQVMFAGDLNSHVTYTQRYSTHTHTHAHNIILQTDWQAIERLRQ